MKTFKTICFIACIILMGIHFYEIDYKNLSSSDNKSHYLGIVVMSLVGLNFVMGIIKDNQNKDTNPK